MFLLLRIPNQINVFSREWWIETISIIKPIRLLWYAEKPIKIQGFVRAKSTKRILLISSYFLFESGPNAYKTPGFLLYINRLKVYV